ncbi:LOW QUALITY PROTEIN: coronin-2A [Rana temporaria]|uniref:LOW QUALITY PROTEIN: coronin-2A n=1 Tax=Rana temporaria TaxID=8407 RepID=UPI001AAC934A|nr:LOW QUALITY PROTEIN: coronin-2A [Rana temporaria]
MAFGHPPQMNALQMSWQPQYRSSKYRHVFGKPANKENCYDNVPITRSVHDNHFCAANPIFIAVVTECAGGGAFIVIPIHQSGKLDSHYPKVCGHRGNVLDIKWNPFDDYVIASCSEDSSVKIWDIPKPYSTKNITNARKELLGHSRRVGLIEWHPTASNIIFSTAYDYKIMIWNLDNDDPVIHSPVRTIECHKDVILSMSFNTNGGLMATSCKDRKIRIIDPHNGRVLQESDGKTHRASKVLFLGKHKKVKSTGASRWNNRQVALWDQDDLSVPLHQEDMDGSSGLLFPFFDNDTNMVYLVGKGEGNIRYYEILPQKPYFQYLNEYRSNLPQKGIGTLPKRGLDVSTCEVFRFYRLITVKGLIEPVSMIVPRRSESYQEDIYPMTAGTQPALTAHEWLSGINRGPILMSLKPGVKMSQTAVPSEEPRLPAKEPKKTYEEKVPTKTLWEIEYKTEIIREDRAKKRGAERKLESRNSFISNGLDMFECPPPRTESELLQMFYKQQDEIRRLREQLSQRDIQIRQLELEIKNVRNSAAPY